ncbi:MAG: hypothetical protein ACLQU2_06230 [Candidatus Binataceae bacterium]
MKRREFLHKSALVVVGTAVAAAVPAVAATGSDHWPAPLKTLSPAQARTLLKMARQIFPHPKLDDAYYITTVQDLDSEAASTPETAKLLSDGVAQLQSSTGGKFDHLTPEQQTTVLVEIQSGPFFQKVRNVEVVSFYNNREVWKQFDYRGASYPFGGYIHHGFNDLNWLPDPPDSASPKG